MYFYELEKRKGTKKLITHLKKSDNTITEDQSEIRNMTKDFYQELFSPDEISVSDRNMILHDLPKLSDTQTDELEKTLTLDELNESVKLLKNVK